MPNASVSGSIDPIATTPGISASPDQEAGALAIPDVMKRSAWPAMGAGKQGSGQAIQIHMRNAHFDCPHSAFHPCEPHHRGSDRKHDRCGHTNRYGDPLDT
jgi:hypothetical protein